MKKLLLGLAVAVLSLGGANVTYAASDCDIYGSGPGSTNTCETIEDFRCTVNNDNDITVYNGNNQAVNTGDADITSNTSGGSSTSGNSSNTNVTVIEGTIKNNTCVVAVAEEETPPVGGGGTVVTPSGESRPVGGMGAVAPVAAPAGRGAVSLLPDTNAESSVGIVASLVALLAATILGSRFAVNAYNNVKS